MLQIIDIMRYLMGVLKNDDWSSYIDVLLDGYDNFDKNGNSNVLCPFVLNQINFVFYIFKHKI